MARPNKTKALERLQAVLDEIPALKQLKKESPEFTKWHRNAEICIANTFGEKSRNVGDFSHISYSPRTAFSLYDDTNKIRLEFHKAYTRGLESAKAILESMIEEIEEYWENGRQKSAVSVDQDNRSINANEIFVIHGRDKETKVTVARFLEHLDLKPIILHEQLNQGKTIIEKFEQHAQVGFAVALLTPDDVGAPQKDMENLKPRARQNVIFEFGYFIGRLGRNRVCALTKGDVEIPSDYDGVIYIPLDDAGGWKIRFVKELKGVGIDVDANRAL